ncbi:MAG: dephospho-CoA kinase [Elusimicrobiota bacterium]
MDRNYLVRLKKNLKGKFIIAVTGVPGSGKSLFCSMLGSMGAHFISSDAVASNLLTKKKCYSKILKEFGSSASGGKLLDKRKLASAVFKDGKKRRWLENYLHPLIANEIYSELKKSQKKIAVIEVPLLFEADFDSFADLTVCVTAGNEKVLSRLSARGWSRKESLARSSAQFSQKKKEELSDIVVCNDAGTAQLKRKAIELIRAAKRLIS